MDSYWFTIAANTLTIVIGVCVLSVLMAVPAAWLLERSRLPWSRPLKTLVPLTYAIPSYLLAMAWIVAANPRVGWLNAWAKNLGLSEEAWINIYSLFGIIFIESSALFSIIFLSFSAGLRQMDPSLEEAARLSGATPFKVFSKISLPILRRNLIAGVLSVALASLASFGVPAMIGGPARIQVFTTGIFSLIKQGNADAFKQALWISSAMAIVCLMVIVFMRKALGGRERQLASARSARHSLVELGPWTYPALISVWSLWLLAVAFPICVLILASFQNQAGPLDISNLGLRAWNYVLFSLPDFHESILTSLKSAALTLAFTITLSLMLALLTWKAILKRQTKRRRLLRAIDDLFSTFYSLPGTVLAIFLIIVSGLIADVVHLSDTLGILVLAYSLKHMSLALKTLQPATLMLHSSLIEAAELSGASYWSRLWHIWIPLLRAPLLASVALVLTPILAELTQSILLYGPGTQNLGVLIFQLQEYADRSAASVVGVLVLVFVLFLQWIASRVQKQRIQG